MMGCPVNLAQRPIEDADPIGADIGADLTALLEALDCLRVAVTLYDSRERLIYLNQHFGYVFRSMPPGPALIGRSFEELVRMELTGGEIDPACYPDGADAFVAARRAQLTASDYAPRDIHLTNGRIIEIKTRRTASGGWIALWSDATHARHDFGRLQNAIEMSADAFALWDRDDRLVLCNPGFAKLHGHRSDANLTGVAFADLLDTVVARKLMTFDGTADSWIERRLQTHRARAGALTVTMANGHAYLVRERATPDGGRATVYTDITDRQRAETAFAEQTQALTATQRALDEQANYLADLTRRLGTAEQGASTAKTTFLRTMSHELKTPLNAIIGFSDMLKSAPNHFSAEQVGEYAGLIHHAGGNLLTMLNQILDLTKIAAGRFVINRTAVTVRGLLDGAYDAIGEAAEDKSIDVQIADCPAELVIDGDANALATMINQLALNAVNFTQPGGTIRLSAEDAGARVRIRVADNGPGVAAADLARIREPFEHGGGESTSHAGGSGLGLPLVQALSELQGGTLSLESDIGEGFIATLDLPAA